MQKGVRLQYTSSKFDRSQLVLLISVLPWYINEYLKYDYSEVKVNLKRALGSDWSCHYMNVILALLVQPLYSTFTLLLSI